MSSSRLPDYIYIIECKLDGSADEALQQIVANNYAAPLRVTPSSVPLA